MLTAEKIPVAEKRLAWCAKTGSYKEAARTEGFIKGPIPLDWISRAANLSGKTLQVALVLWYLAGLKRSTTVSLGAKQLSMMGVSRDAKYEALRRLKEAGLVSVEQSSGRAPLISLLRK
jgi:DNA-binding transcriptional ArsR family regulator